jgi:hypothetical protein
MDQSQMGIGVEVVVVLPDPKRNSEKVRRAIIREGFMDPNDGILVFVDVESDKRPGLFYQELIKVSQIVALYQTPDCLARVRAERAAGAPVERVQGYLVDAEVSWADQVPGTPSGANPLSNFQAALPELKSPKKTDLN